MWARIYPHVILLIFVNIFKVSCVGTSSLSFVIDDTGSMQNDINQVKRSANEIMDIVYNEKASLIHNMVLVTVNDPVSTVRVVTQNRDTFKRSLDAVYAHNIVNYDCWEPSMQGILLALERSLPGSYIYVFTDASAKDYEKGALVMEMCQRKQSQIVFVLTGRCYSYNEQSFRVFYDIAAACSGLAFYIDSRSVNQVLHTIEETIKGNKTVITSKIVPSRTIVDIPPLHIWGHGSAPAKSNAKQTLPYHPLLEPFRRIFRPLFENLYIRPERRNFHHPFTIDDQTDYAIISVSGNSVKLEVRGPHSHQDEIMWHENGKVIKLSGTTPGQYTATVWGTTATSIVIVGRTDFRFTHGFSALEPKTMSDTTPQPIAETDVYLSISVTDSKHLVHIESAQILNEREKPIGKPLPLIQKSEYFYITKPFVAPSHRFKISVQGIVMTTGEHISRINKIPITPQDPPKRPDKMKPTAKIEEGNSIEVKYNSSVKLTCKVLGYPRPQITWFNNIGAPKKSSNSILQEPYEYISYMTLRNVVQRAEYSCYASNEQGNDSKKIIVSVKNPLVVRTTPAGITRFYYGSKGTLICDIESSLPMNILWYYANEITGVNAQITSSDKYQISSNGTQLKITKMDMDLVGKYTCKASLLHSTDFQKSYSTRVEAAGLIRPKITGLTTKKVIKGTTVVLECSITSGVPVPKITWEFKAKTSANYKHVSDAKVLHISRVSDLQEGQYKCLAENVVGKDEHVISLIIQELPQITSLPTSAYQGIEGDAQLRIPCIATGVPKPVVKWYLNGHAISANGKHSIEDDALIIRNPTVSDTHSYTCEATSEVGRQVAIFPIHILQVPKVTGVGAKKVTVGTPTKIECQITKGEPKPKITWQFMDQSGSKFIPIAGSDTVLRISSAKNKHAGLYKCIAQNNVGTADHVTTLIVQEPPKIPSSSKSVYEGKEGDALLRIPCVATGLPKPVITWKLDGHVISPNSKYSIEDGALTIKNPTVSDTHLYTCAATNEVGVITATFQTHILQAPEVSGVDAKKVTVGKPTKIECQIAKGEPKPKITWQFMDKSGSKFMPIAGSDTVLRISSAENRHAGRYKCIAQNNVGTADHVTALIVQAPPKIPSSSNSVYEGKEGDALLRIPCGATGLPKPVITWKLDGHVISPNAKYSIEDGSLTIKNPKVSDTHLYTCEATNEVGVITATFQTHILQAPEVSGVDSKKVTVGTPTKIECQITKGEPKPKITWQFMDQSGLKFIPIAGSDTVLRISSAEKKHAGLYKCIAQNNVGTTDHVTTLIVQEPPKIPSSSKSVYEGKEGDALLRIPCGATGLPKPVITWKLDGHVISPNAKYSIEDGALTIKNPTVSDTHLYRCEATNDVGVITATFQTHILQLPLVSGEDSKKVKIGTPDSIECQVIKGEPKPKITWQFMEKSGSKYIPIAGSDTVLRISSAEKKHAGRYKCIAQNNVGTADHVTTLIVQEPPRIPSSSNSVYEGKEGDSLLRIPCVATGLPKPTITWKLDDHVISSNTKYTIEDGALIVNNPTVSDTHLYTCEAKNEVGVETATFQTHILQTPKVLGVPSMTVRIGTPANIECTVVKGEPKPKITWFFMDKSVSTFAPVAVLDNVLRISRVEKKDAGSYKCVAQNGVGGDEHVTALTVEFPPEITSNTSIVYEGLQEDLALRIPCDAVGIPKPVISWKLRGNAIIPNEKYAIEDGALVIKDPKKNDSTLYTCEATNSLGSTSANFKANIEEDLGSYGTEDHIYLLKGETRKLNCETFSSKSHSIRWFTNGIYNKTDDSYEVVNATVELDGNYTCRVSDNHGFTHTHTYVVDVGYPPKLYNSLELNEWRGDVTDILTKCDADAKPSVTVEWKFNNQVLSDQDAREIGISYKWGHYTCNVSNVHGSVETSFDVKSSACLINRNLKDAEYMPLLLTDDLTWPQWETTKYFSIVDPEEKIKFTCPNHKGAPNVFKKFPEQTELKAFCSKEDLFLVNGKLYKLSELQCSVSLEPSIIRKKEKCLTEKSESIRVGYNVGGFLETYEVCYDHAIDMPLYTRVLTTATDGTLNPAHNWYKYPGIGDSKVDKGFTCKDSLSSCCYSKSQLVNARDFNYSPAKNSTFIDPLNVVPVWHPCRNTRKTSWQDIEELVRMQLVIYSEFIVWTGTHTLQENHGEIIPRYLWKVLRFDEDEAMAIVYVNDASPTEKDIKCENICTEEHWLTPKDKYTYCCNLEDFLNAFDLSSTDVGESMDSALDKIGKSS